MAYTDTLGGSDSMNFMMQQYLDENGFPVKRTPITHPYSYDAYVIWGAKNKDSHGVYTDRLLQWDYKKHNELCKLIWDNTSQLWDSRQPKDIQTFLRKYNNDENIILTMVMKCYNVSNGYPVWILFYRTKEVK